jgi:hypothetical protein
MGRHPQRRQRPRQLGVQGDRFAVEQGPRDPGDIALHGEPERVETGHTHRVRGRGHHRLRGEQLTHLHGEFIGPAAMPADQRHGEPSALVDAHDPRVGPLVAQQRGDQPYDGSRGEEAHELLALRERGPDGVPDGTLVHARTVRPRGGQPVPRTRARRGGGNEADHEATPSRYTGVRTRVSPQQKNGIGGREPGHVTRQRRQPGRLQQHPVDRETGRRESLPHGRYPVERGHRDDHGPPGPPRARGDDGGQFAPAPADEHGVGIVEVGQHGRRRPVHGVHVDAVRLGVGADPLDTVPGLLDGGDGGAEPRALDGHGPGARADVPDQFAEPRPEPGQRQRPYLELGDHRVPVLELPLVQRPLGGPDGSPGDRPHGTQHSRLVQTQHHAHRRTPVPGGGLGGRDPFDLLLPGTERGRDDEDTPAGPVGERGAQFGGSGPRPGQHGDLGMRAARVDRRTQIASVRADDDRVVPGQPGAGEGGGDGGDAGAYVEGVAGEPFRQRPYDPEEPGVPRGQHDDGLALPDVGLDGVEGGRERTEDDLLGVLRDVMAARWR